MKSFGSIWALAVAHLLAVSPHGEGLLYLAPDGTLLLAGSDKEAPPDAHYICRVNDGVAPMLIAARLEHVASCQLHGPTQAEILI